ncbi:Uncharacterized protein Rs2_03149 [Raphanus sativus]|nr:Uncharacterized protein Rs2_03149 [Raphanus sativus]
MRRFNRPHKHSVVKRWVFSEKPLFGCLLKQGLKAYLVLLGPSVTVTLLHKSAQIISCAIQMAVGDQLICFAIYGSNFTTARRQLWDDIRATQQAYKHTLDPTWEL